MRVVLPVEMIPVPKTVGSVRGLMAAYGASFGSEDCADATTRRRLKNGSAKKLR